MPDVLKGNRDTLPDHMTPDGDHVLFTYRVEAIGVDGKTVFRHLEISIYSSGALSVSGNTGDEAWALSLLEHAQDALSGYHRRTGSIVIPGRDASLPEGVTNIYIRGPVEERAYAIACMENAKASLKDMHARRRAHAASGSSIVRL